MLTASVLIPTSNRRHLVVELLDRSGQEPPLHALLGALEDRVNGVVILVLRVAWLHIERLACLDHAQRQIVVDVGVHSRQRELERRDPRIVAGVKQGRPRGSHLGRASGGAVNGRELRVPKVDVKSLQERRRFEPVLLHVVAHRQGDLEVQAVEPMHAV